MNSIQDNTESLSTLKAQGIVQGTVSSFRSFALARSSAYHHVKPARIIMGDCTTDDCSSGWYWVVSPADAERLVQAGYELIR
ncbi:MAG TPA: hypothetical protein VGM92_05500 [Candidatus Kapabacteria bacterium]|jgi:hypothetical protein